MPFTRSLKPVLAAVLLAGPGAYLSPFDATAGNATPAAAMQVDWKLLLPEDQRANSSRPPPLPPNHDYLSGGDMMVLQTGSFEPNPALNNKRVRMPGFVVPLEQAADGHLSEFLLVPYFGACIHLPPPPPNQVVYVKMRPGAGPMNADNAIWVTGTLHEAVQKSSMASAAYVLDADSTEIYQPSP